MSKKSQRRARAQAKKAAQAVQSPAKPKKVEFVARPFAGLKNEAELVAMAQIIPAATMTVKLNDSEHIPAAHRGATGHPAAGPNPGYAPRRRLLPGCHADHQALR